MPEYCRMAGVWKVWDHDTVSMSSGVLTRRKLTLSAPVDRTTSRRACACEILPLASLYSTPVARGVPADDVKRTRPTSEPVRTVHRRQLNRQVEGQSTAVHSLVRLGRSF